MEENITYETSGIQCDTEGCDYADPTVTVDDLINWIDKPCPICGANLLTQADYDNFMKLIDAVKLVNSMSSEELEELYEASKDSGIPLVDDLINLGESDPEGSYTMTVEVKDGDIRLKAIVKKEDETDNS